VAVVTFQRDDGHGCSSYLSNFGRKFLSNIFHDLSHASDKF